MCRGASSWRAPPVCCWRVLCTKRLGRLFRSRNPKLALHGGEKAVKESAASGPRWGEPERQQLEAMLQQDSLFYWQGPQTKLLTERFQADLSGQVRADLFLRHGRHSHCRGGGRDRTGR